jgi:hypothetical protein
LRAFEFIFKAEYGNLQKAQKNVRIETVKMRGKHHSRKSASLLFLTSQSHFAGRVRKIKTLRNHLFFLANKNKTQEWVNRKKKLVHEKRLFVPQSVSSHIISYIIISLSRVHNLLFFAVKIKFTNG